MITRHYVLISGFRQDYARMTGMDRLFQTLLPRSSGTTRVDYYQWDEDWNAVAAFIHRHANRYCSIIIAAYSWGAGYGALCLCKSLQDRGRGVEHAILTDPVYRNPWAPDWFSLLPSSLIGERKIKYPPSVREISWFYQRRDKPSSHKPVGAKTVHGGVELQFPHAGMDDALEFHEAVLNV